MSGYSLVSVRDAVREIPSIGYGTFSIYAYPAKFIPQIPWFILKRHGRPGTTATVFDPFAGSGVTGLVARVHGYNYILWDLNPLLKVIHDAAILKPLTIDLPKLLSDIRNSKEEFMPKWSNIYYWHPRSFLDVLSKAWGYVHSLEDGDLKRLLVIPLLKVTKYFSYTDEKREKLYRTRVSIEKVEKLLRGDWRQAFYNMLGEGIRKTLRKIYEYNRLKPKDVNHKILAGVDTLSTHLEEDVDIMITSPPYIQAHEYIRASKIELYWLGYTDNDIRMLQSKEIPYREVQRIKVDSKTYEDYRAKINIEHRTLYDRYFHAIIKAFTTLSERVTDTMAVVVGRSRIQNTPIPIDVILVEHMENNGWKHEITYIDRIKMHKYYMKLNNILDSEYIVILKRKR